MSNLRMLENDDRLPTEVFDDYWILAIAKDYRYNSNRNIKIESGKWLIFEHIEELNSTWEKVKKATISGELGSASKTATAKPNPNAQNKDIKVICVYTSNFNDEQDVIRVESNLRKIGIENKLLYKLNKDVGKYRNQGHKRLSVKISYSKKYYEILDWLIKNPRNKYIKLIKKNPSDKNQFKFDQVNLSKLEFRKKIITLDRLGFRIRGNYDYLDRSIIFSE